MKYSLLFIGIFCFFACSSPQKYLEKGSYEKAFLQSLKKLKNGKIKKSDLQTLEESFSFLNSRDQKAIDALRERNQGTDWPDIFELALIISDRQREATPVVERLEKMGEAPLLSFYPVSPLLEESRKKSAIYYYARAQEHLPSARSGDRQAARKAHGLLDKSQEYLTDYRGTEALQEEMRALGTHHILLSPVLDSYDPELSDELFQTLLWNKKFPFREDWQMYHIQERDDQELHYQLNLSFPLLQSSGNQMYSDVCYNNVEIEQGFILQREWNTLDSSWVDVEVPNYITVSGTINTFDQLKEVVVEMEYELIDWHSKERIRRRPFREASQWQNIYSTWVGDERARVGSCEDFGGYWMDFPLEENMFIEAVDKMRWNFFDTLEDPF